MAEANTEFKLETAKCDARFPNSNQTRNCWQNYLDFHRCVKAKGEDYDPCQYFKRVYKSLCPVAWVSWLLLILTEAHLGSITLWLLPPQNTMALCILGTNIVHEFINLLWWVQA